MQESIYTCAWDAGQHEWRRLRKGSSPTLWCSVPVHSRNYLGNSILEVTSPFKSATFLLSKVEQHITGPIFIMCKKHHFTKCFISFLSNVFSSWTLGSLLATKQERPNLGLWHTSFLFSPSWRNCLQEKSIQSIFITWQGWLQPTWACFSHVPYQVWWENTFKTPQPLQVGQEVKMFCFLNTHAYTHTPSQPFSLIRLLLSVPPHTQK